MAEELANLRIEDFASIDDYYAKVEEIQNQYQERIAAQEAELNKAVGNNKELYDTDWTNYSNATGYKISDTEKFVTSFSDSMLGLLTGSESDVSNFGGIIGAATEGLVEGLRVSAEEYYNNIQAAMQTAGTSLEEFADKVETDLNRVKTATSEAQEEVKKATDEMTSGFNNLADTIAEWQTTYGAAIDNAIAKNE
jgi:hypothetical protein